MSILLHKNARVDLFGNAVIPAGTTVIGRMAFHKCERLRRVQIPGTVERIEERAFAGCENLRSILLTRASSPLRTLRFQAVICTRSFCRTASARCPALRLTCARG